MSLPYKKIPSAIVDDFPPTGQIPLDQLSRVYVDRWLIGDFQIQAARAMRAMAASARQSGIIIASSGDYRSYSEQVTLFRSRYVDTHWTTNPPGSFDDRLWPRAIYGGTGTYWRRVRGAAAAVPGKSNHGLGIANDMAQRLPSGAIVALTVKVGAMSLWDWLNIHGRRYGWSWGEAISENWHWVYIEGDDIPKAVLDYENATNPPIPTEEIIMQWARFEGDPTGQDIAFSAAGWRKITPKQRDQMRFVHLLRDGPSPGYPSILPAAWRTEYPEWK